MPKLPEDEGTLGKLTKLGLSVLEQVERGQSPYIEKPLRSLSNVIYDNTRKILMLGDKKARRYFLNIAHARAFMQTMLIVSKCKELVENARTASQRELYYQLKHTVEGLNENTFEEQEESNPIIVDLETALDVLREHLHITADRSGTLFGPITIEDQGDVIDCMKLGKSGLSIPSIVDDYKFIDHDADYVLVVETGAMSDRLVEERYHIKNKAIIVSTGGQASRGVRRLVRLLNERLELPIIVFTDGDPWGYYIYSVLKTGSINLAYESKRLATPQAKFVGMTMDDIEKYDLKKATEKLKGVPPGKSGGPTEDFKRALELMNYEWFKNDVWQRQLKKMIEMGVRIEQQALASKKLEFVAEEYLPKKIKAGEFLP
jgi:DNA topoisomerase-6 subunit A